MARLSSAFSRFSRFNSADSSVVTPGREPVSIPALRTHVRTVWDDSNDWELTSAANDTPEQLYAFWDGAVERSRARLGAALTDGGVDQLVHVSGPDGRHVSLRRLLCDLIEEYGRHTGHADLLREAVDGLVGEDPPAGWQPTAGRSRLSG